MKNIKRYLKFKNIGKIKHLIMPVDILNLPAKPFKKSRVSGQSSVEFALVLPFLLIIILIVFQLGCLVYLQNIVEHAVSESARIVATTNSDSMAYETAYGILKKINGDNIDINIQPSPGKQRKTGNMVRVEIAYTYPGAANIIRLLAGRDMLIKSSCSVRMECGDD